MIPLGTCNQPITPLSARPHHLKLYAKRALPSGRRVLHGGVYTAVMALINRTISSSGRGAFSENHTERLP